MIAFTILLVVLALAITGALILSMFKPIRIEVIRTTKVTPAAPVLVPARIEKSGVALKDTQVSAEPFTPTQKEEDIAIASMDAVVRAANELMGIETITGEKEDGGN